MSSVLPVWMALTAGMRQRCFEPHLLQRLRGMCDLRVADAADEPALAARWMEEVGDAAVVITGWHTPPITAAMLAAAPQLQLILHAAGSIRALVPEEAFERGIRVATANAALARGVAETTLGLVIVGLKGIFPASRLVAGGGWKRGDFETPGVRVRETYGSTVGIVGAGEVGRQLIALLQPLGMRVLVHDPFLEPQQAAGLGVERVDLPELLERSDVVSLSAAALPSTRHLIGAAQLAAMRPGAILINTARGMLVDEAALVAELRRGRIWAFLDVTDPEPPVADHPLRSLPNVVLTPHLAGALNNGCLRLGACVVEQLAEYQAGRPLTGEVQPHRRAVMA